MQLASPSASGTSRAFASPARAAVLGAAPAHLQAGRFAPLRDACATLLAQDPDDIEAALFLGLALGALGQAGQAAALLDHVARHRRGFAHPCRDLAALLRQSGHPERIAPQFREALRHAPDDAALLYAFADHLHDTGEYQRALQLLHRTLALDPGFAPARNLAGIVAADLGDIDAAIAHFRAAIAVLPGDATARANLGLQLKVAGRFEEAIAAYDEALAHAPADPHIRLNRAIALLRAGRLAEAWPDYECRYHRSGARPMLPPERLLPALSACPGLAGRTILVTHEDGFGDTLQFARYLPALAATGARVLVWLPRELASLIAAVPGIAGMLSGSQAAPPHDYHCPFTSLPRAFETTLADIPAAVPYLRPDPGRVAAWAARLPPRRPGQRRIGLAWAGQSRPDLPGFDAMDARRSLSLADCAPLAAVRDVQFISLQKGVAATQAPPPGLALHDPMRDVTDFADTAAIVAGLDAVISVDTSVAHLAGALACPVMLLDRYDSCWRWLAAREDSPWYPSLRIFRQPRPGAWPEVLHRAAAALNG